MVQILVGDEPQGNLFVPETGLKKLSHSSSIDVI